MDRLWAPWRNKYIVSTISKKEARCIFCLKDNQNNKKNHILEKTKYSFSILNKYPYNNGHIMVAPFKHVKSLEYLSDVELLDLMRLLNKTKKLLEHTLRPDGFNIGINLGKVAGAGFKDHVHIHIVPRWSGDTNFMPVSSQTKVISESLSSLYKRLKHADKG